MASKFKVGDRVKFKSNSDYVEPKDRSKTFKVEKLRGNEVYLNDDYGYVPDSELYSTSNESNSNMMDFNKVMYGD